MTFRYRRSGFTLVELLVVIAIIAIVAALALVAIIPFLGKGPEIKTVQEISQLSIAVQNFKNKYGVYPPSLIYLSNNVNNYTTLQKPVNAPSVSKALADESMGYITRIWPRINWVGMNWSGAGGGPWILYGDQCLVFFLGGIGGTNGFGTNPQNPTAAPWAPPLFSFEGGRLFKRPGESFNSYYDHFGSTTNPFPASKPYVYFSSGKGYNGYNSGGVISHAHLGVSPYPTYPLSATAANPNSFQIISAGANGPTLGFGPGTGWTPNTGSYATGGAGFDDLSNFCPNKLGVGP